MFSARRLVVFAVAVPLFLAGCARVSPAVGTWTGTADAGPLPVNQTATVTLSPDGRGFVKLAIIPEQPVNWTEENNKVILTIGGAAAGTTQGGRSGSGAASALVGTLSDDKKTMNIDLGMAKLTLKKAE